MMALGYMSLEVVVAEISLVAEAAAMRLEVEMNQRLLLHAVCSSLKRGLCATRP